MGYSEPRLVQFGQPLDQIKKLYLKFVIREIHQFPCENPTFFLDQLQKKFFTSYSLPTQGIIHAKFVSIWTFSWPDETDLFFKFYNRNLFEILAIFRMKYGLFSYASIIKNFSCPTTYLHRGYSKPGLAQFGQVFYPIKKKQITIVETRYSRNSKTSVWKTNFFHMQARAIFFVLQSTYTG